jgi:hypothetical protein
MPPDDSASDDRLDRIEARLDRLERAVDNLRSVIEGAGGESRTAEVEDDRREKTGPVANSSDGQEDSVSGSTSSVSRPTREHRQTSTADAGTSPAPSQEGAGSAAQTGSGPSRILPSGLRSEDWLSYVGVGLFLFGLAFLFKYSVEQGWLVPTVRVGFGGLTGSVLLGAGLRIYADRQRLRQVLMGGSSATFYGTIFAAYQLYGLVSYPVAFGGMVAVTVITIVLGLGQDHASMAVIGTMGGLGTPFLLYADVGGMGGFSVYTSLVLGGACMVYVYRGWRSLLYVAVVGGWGVLLVPCVDAALTGERPSGAWALQAGLMAAWLLLGGAPVVRALLRTGQPGRWPSPHTLVGTWDRALLGGRSAYGTVTTAPFMALFATRLLWRGTDLLWAAVAAGGMLVYGAAYVALRRVPLPRYVPAHGLVAAVLATYGLSEAVGGATLLLAWAVEAVLLLAMAHRLRDATLRRSGHALAVLVGGWLGLRFVPPPASAPPLVSSVALSEVLALGAGVGALWWTRSLWGRRLYRGGLIAGWFGWWASQLLPLPQGPTYLLLVAGGTAAGLLGYARRGGDWVVRYAGHVAFAGVAGALAVRWSGGDPGPTPLVGLASLAELIVLGLGGAVSWQMGEGRERTLYQGGVLVGWLGWWAHELVPLPNGQAYVSLVWGVTAAVLLVGGGWYRHQHVQKAGLATLALFVGKLFLVDLTVLSALWRVALFLGAGGAFLLISYSLPGLGASTNDAND